MKKKKIVTLFFSILFAFLFILPAYGQIQNTEPIKIFLGEKQVSFTSPPIKEGDTLLVPLDEIMETLGADVYEIVPQAKYSVVKGNKQYNFTVGNPYIIIYTKNGTLIDTHGIEYKPAPQLKNKVVYIPVKAAGMMLTNTHYVNYIPEANMILMGSFITDQKPNMELIKNPKNNTQNYTSYQTTTSGAIQINGIEMEEYKKEVYVLPEWIHEDALRQYTPLSIGPAADENNGMEIFTKKPGYKRLLYFEFPKSLTGWSPKADMEIEISVDNVRLKVLKSPYALTRFKLNTNDLIAKGWLVPERDGITVKKNDTSILDEQIKNWMDNNPDAFDFS